MSAADFNPLKDFVREQMSAVGMVPPERVLPKEQDTRISSLRRRSNRRIDDPITSFSLVEDAGVVRFTPGAVLPYASGRRGGRGAPSGNVLGEFKFEDLDPNQVQAFLADTDETIRGKNKGQKYGLHEWDLDHGHHYDDKIEIANEGRILLIVHGFISSTNHLINEVRAIKKGEAFLKQLSKHYKQVLTFDHPTVSVSPLLNALDLHRALGYTKATVDVICHSRGGLVTRWWLEGLGGPQSIGRRPRVIFLGSPLAGTSLASPARLRAVMDLLASIGSFFSKASEFGAGAAPFAAPFLVVAGALFKVFSYATKAIAKTPIIDAGINMAAGISGMSRVGNNPELMRLRHGFSLVDSPDYDYFAVKTNFEPTDEGWRFWRYFYNLGDRGKNLFMDHVFDEPNDLIVNTASMTQLGPKPGEGREQEENIADATGIRRVLDYNTSDRIHHFNYFRQPDTIDFFRQTLLQSP
jgi:hypothetical protein